MSSFTRSLILEDTGDGRLWRVYEGFRYWRYAVNSGLFVDIREGFLTDMASVPRVMRAIVPAQGRGNAAAVLHDWLYQRPWLYSTDDKSGPVPLTRANVDGVFYEALRVQGASKLRATAMHAGVRVGGWVAWNRYRKQFRKSRNV